MTATSGQYYRSFDGDVTDRIAYDHYGQTAPETLQMIMDANPHLNQYGAVLPEGVQIFLPDIPPAPKTEAMRLW